VSGGSNHLGSNQNKHKLDIRIIGSEGQFHIDLERELAWIYRPGELDEQFPVSPGDGAYNCDGPIHTLIDLALGKDVTNQSPGEVGARTVEVIEGAYRSVEAGLPISVSSLR
jgi:predicted dehydrogenase